MAFATLPMYSAEPLRPAWQALWERAAAHLGEAGIRTDETLCWPDDPYAAWHDGDMALGQTCGWPLVSLLGDKVVPFARFDFGLPDTPPGDYHSVFVARSGTAVDQPGGLAPVFLDAASKIAVNGTDSQSGFRVLGECVAEPLVVRDAKFVVTGSHAASIEAVAAGQAELAAIDAVTWHYALRHQNAAGELQVLARSCNVPGLPLITATRFSDRLELLASALRAAIEGLDAHTRQTLGIRQLVPAKLADYAILNDAPFGRVSLAVT